VAGRGAAAGGAAGDGGVPGGGAASKGPGAAGGRGPGPAGDRPAVAAQTVPTARGAASSRAVAEPAASRSNGATSGNGHAHGDRAGRVATSPAIRRRAHEAGVDLSQLSGSGPNGRHSCARISKPSFPAAPDRSSCALAAGRAACAGGACDAGDQGHRRAPPDCSAHERGEAQHSALLLCEEFDVTELESRAYVVISTANSSRDRRGSRIFPFIVSALIRVLRDFPQCNAQYDSERGVIIRHSAVHVGVATQTPEGLKVPCGSRCSISVLVGTGSADAPGHGGCAYQQGDSR